MAHTTSKAAAGVPFYTPAQEPPAGTALNGEENLPTLFTPLKIRSKTLTNRLVVSPMCMYSADDGHLTDFHLVHLGQFALNGAALVFVEATAVQAVGRISPEDSGLWKDSQIAPLKRITDFVHSQGRLAGIQLAHAGRKASTLAPWLAGAELRDLAKPEDGGWPDEVVAPSAIPFAGGYAMPRALTLAEIKGVVQSFKEAAERAVKAGFDVIEIHGAHGYLISEFLSPLSNTRTDEYGGSFENRTRLVLEVIQAVRSVIPDTLPLFLRISTTEWMEYAGAPSWDVPSSIRLAKLLPALGVDLLDASSGGNNSEQRIQLHKYYQVDIAGQVRDALRADGQDMLVGAVGMISEAEMARDIVQQDAADGTVEVVDEHGAKAKADIVLMARQFLREPNWVLRVADDLGVNVRWPNQYLRAPRKKKPTRL